MKISLCTARTYRGTTTKLGKLAKLKQHFPTGLKFHHQEIYDGNTTRQHTLYFGSTFGYPSMYMNVVRSINDPNLTGNVSVSPPMDVASAPIVGDNSPPSAG